MATGAVSTQKQRSLAWSGDVKDLRSRVNTIEAQGERFLGPDPDHPGADASEFRITMYEEALRSRRAQFSISERELDTTITGLDD